MFSLKPKKSETHPLDDLITEAINALSGIDETTELYTTAVRNLKDLMELRAEDIQHSKRRPSPDAILAAATTFGSIAMILVFEQKNVITSKSLSMIPKLRS